MFNKYFLLLFLVLLPLASASSPVTYTCCQNFTTSSGTVIESFDNNSGWANAGGTGVISNNTVYVKEGSGSVWVNVSGVNTWFDKTININLSNADNFSFWLYADPSGYTDDPTNFSYVNLSYVKIYFFNGSGSGDYYIANITYVQLGWNHIVMNKSFFRWSASNMNWTYPMIKMRINPTPYNSRNVNFTIDGFTVNNSGRAKTIITFDDGRESVQRLAKPILDANNQRAVSFVITQSVGTNDAYYMNTTQLSQLYNSGWDISSHTQNHVDLTNTSNSISDEINGSHADLLGFGYSRSAQFIAYPYGYYNLSTLNALQSNFTLGLTAQNGLTQSNVDSTNDNYTHYTIQRTTPSQALTKPDSISNTTLNDTITRSGLNIIILHNVLESCPCTANDISVSNLTNLSNSLASKSSYMDVITLSDIMIKNVPNNTPVFNRTVNIASNGTTSIVVDNQYGSDTTLNMSVIPSSDSVNVTVTSWTINGNKTWTESSTNHSVTSQHYIGDFPANRDVQLRIDGILQSTVLTSNSTGYIAFTYIGGYSDHIFQTSLASQAFTTFQSVCTSNVNYISTSMPLFGLAIMIFAFAFILFELRNGLTSGINKNMIITAVFVAIIGFSLLILGNYLIYAIISATGC